MASTDFGYCIFIIANEKFMDVFVRSHKITCSRASCS